MKTILKKAGKTLIRLHRSEQGAEGLEKLLIMSIFLFEVGANQVR